jgi:RNA polymerase sigma-70 factor (ECF subfamily)
VVPTGEDDALLLARIAKGGEEARQALADLYQRHVTAVHAALGRLDRSLNVQDREDLAQHVFAEVWRHPGRFRGESSVLHYLGRIAANLLSNHRRRESRRIRREIAAPSGSGADGQEVIRQHEAADIVGMALAQLPAEQRQAVELICLHGRTVAEAATMVGCSRAALQKRLYWGKMRLRQRLERLL